MHDGRPQGSSYSNVKAKLIKRAQNRPEMKKNPATGYLNKEDRASGAKPGSTVRPALNRQAVSNVQRLPSKVGEMGVR